jgi:hypothetical protein
LGWLIAVMNNARPVIVGIAPARTDTAQTDTAQTDTPGAIRFSGAR